MAITLVQSNRGGAASISGVTPLTATTNAVGFASPTTSGNLLVAIARATSNTTAGAPSGFLPTTSGYTWGPKSGGQFFTTPQGGVAALYFIQNATSMPTTTATSWSAAEGGSGVTVTSLKAEFELYEFSGIAAVASDTSANLVSGNATPSTANLVTTATDLIVSFYCGNSALGTAVAAGTAFTLGFSATLAAVGQMQYQLNVPAGTVTTSFGGSFAGSWACGAIAFKASPVVAVSTAGQPLIFGF